MNNSIVCGHFNSCRILLDHFSSLWPGTIESISCAAIFNELLFKIAVSSERLSIFVAGLSDAFVTAFNLRRTHCILGHNFSKLMYGRIRMMADLFPTWAHTYQTMCLGFNPEQLRPEASDYQSSPKNHKKRPRNSAMK